LFFFKGVTQNETIQNNQIMTDREYDTTGDRRRRRELTVPMDLDELTDSKIIEKQKSNGSWELNDLAEVLSWDKKFIEAKNPCSDLTVWTTSLALHFLEKHFSHKIELWTMVAKKAVDFVTTECKINGYDYDNITQAAIQVLSQLENQDTTIMKKQKKKEI